MDTAPLERLYGRIGRRNLTVLERAADRRAWRGYGAIGALWLAGHAAKATDVELMEGIANTLADIGQVGVNAILLVLDQVEHRDHAMILLKALKFMTVKLSQVQYLAHRYPKLAKLGDPDVIALLLDLIRDDEITLPGVPSEEE